jgi:hypothetical protein
MSTIPCSPIILSISLRLTLSLYDRLPFAFKGSALILRSVFIIVILFRPFSPMLMVDISWGANVWVIARVSTTVPRVSFVGLR